MKKERERDLLIAREDPTDNHELSSSTVTETVKFNHESVASACVYSPIVTGTGEKIRPRGTTRRRRSEIHVATSTGHTEETDRFTTRPYNTTVATRLNQTRPNEVRPVVAAATTAPSSLETAALLSPRPCQKTARWSRPLRILRRAKCIFPRCLLLSGEPPLRCKPVSCRVGDEPRKSRFSPLE